MARRTPMHPAAKTATKPKAPAAAPQVLRAKDLLGDALQLARSGGLDAAFAELRKVARQEKRRGPTFSDRVMVLATALSTQDPALARDVARTLLEDPTPPAEAHLIVGSACDRLGDRKGAESSMRAVIESSNAKPGQRLRAANLLVRFGAQEVALDAARKAFLELGEPLEQAATMLYIAQVTADWPLVDRLTRQLRDAYADGAYEKANESPRTNLLWCGDESINIATVSQWSKRVLQGAKPVPPRLSPLAGRRIRVGYLSSDFREHPTSRLINGLLRHHDRSRFEVSLYCSGWDDGSVMRREVESNVDHVHAVAHLSDEAAADLIRSHGIDVLVELNGPTRANRMGILVYRPAPVQIDYLGWPGSVGGRVVDYVVGDFYTVPEGAERAYPERVIRIHHTYQVNDYAARQLPPAPTRKAVGLPEDPNVRVLGMFNAINKVHADVWQVWMRILKAVPDSVLWILDPGSLARRHIAQAARKAGVAVNRILAAPRMVEEQHIARLQRCDLMLDPWPYGGHTSTADALFAGVPVVTLEGRNFAGRVSGGLLKAAGLPELVQPDIETYVNFTVDLLQRPGALESMRREVARRVPGSDVFRADSKARQLEAAYTAALRMFEKGEPFKHLRITPPEGAAARSATPAATPTATAKARPVRPLATEAVDDRQPLIVVCGPWSGGTSAVAGMLARAGLWAPGPYIQVNDPRTPETTEMLAFREALRAVASEAELRRTASPAETVAALQAFRDGPLAKARRAAGIPAGRPVLLKHGLAALVLPELATVFDLRIVGVLRPIAAVEATRVRRGWAAHLGAAGARVIYSHLFQHLVSEATPFHLVRFADVRSDPPATLDRLLDFCGLQPTQSERRAALDFVTRDQAISRPAEPECAPSI